MQLSHVLQLYKDIWVLMFLLATNGLSMNSISMFTLMRSLKGITCASIYIAYSDAFFQVMFSEDEHKC